jgi:hypothetical protein
MRYVCGPTPTSSRSTTTSRSCTRVACLLLLVAGSVAAATAPDTEKLAAHLKSLRGHSQLSAEEYQNLRKEYLTWLDLRIRSGWNANQLNWDLGNAGLVLQPAEQSQEQPLRHAPDLLAITVSVDPRDLGGACSRTITTILYDRKTLHRVAEIDPGLAGYRVLDIDAGERDYTGRRLVATRWAASKCASSFNYERIRIDQLNGSVVKNLLSRDLNTADGGADHPAAEVNSNVVTFRFNSPLPDSEQTVVSVIARYQIAENHATRLSPIAFSRAGFIQEWLAMTDANPADWATPEAVQQRTAGAAELKGRTFEWGRIANCGNGVWDIAVMMSRGETQRVFKISGNRASDLKILSISEAPDQTCRIVDDIAPVSEPLLW